VLLDFVSVKVFLHVYLLFHYNFLIILIVRVGVLTALILLLIKTGLLPSQLCSATAIAYKGNRILENWRRTRRLLATFSLRMCRNSYLGASGKRFDFAIRFGALDFL